MPAFPKKWLVVLLVLGVVVPLLQPWLPDLVICRPELAESVLAAVAAASAG